MTSLYNIGNELQSIADDVTVLLEQGADPNSDEVQQLLQKMVAQESDWDTKALRVAKFLNHIKAQQEIVKLEVDRLQKKMKQLGSTFDNLHDLLLWQMQGFGKTEIKDPILSIKVRDNPPSVIIEDESLIPNDYKTEKTTVTVNKTRIKAAFNAGEQVDGDNIVNSQRLEFK